MFGLLIGFVGVVILTSRGLGSGTGSDITGEIALLGAALSYAVGAVYLASEHARRPSQIPAVFQVTFAMLIAGAIALVTEHPWDVRPGIESIFAIIWLGILGSGVAYLVNFRFSPRGARPARRSSRTSFPSSGSSSATWSWQSRSTAG